MASSRQRAALAVLAIAFLACAGVASAARPAPARGCGEEATATLAYLHVYPAVVEKATETVEMLMARLPAGPSPKGPGH